jgi:hypothetical protein
VEKEGRRIEHGSLRVRVHMRKKLYDQQFAALEAEQPERVVSEERVGFPVDVIEAPYRLQSSFGFFFPPAVAPRPAPAPLAGPGASPGAGPGVTQEVLPRRGRYRPLRGGSSGIRQYGTSATLGGFVIDRATGAKMALSNYHVLAGSYAYPGLPTVQPSPNDSGLDPFVVANYTRDAMLDSMDAAVAKLIPGVQCINDQIGLGPVTGLGSPQMGMVVTKSGRTTGVTTAQIDGMEGESGMMNYGGFKTVIRNVFHIAAMNGGAISDGGDSGSWWLEKATNRAVALHFAGNAPGYADYALAISMPKVLDALKVDLAL